MDNDDRTVKLLEAVDTYQEQQKKAFAKLGSGFLDLARANYANDRNIRYGQDFYNESALEATRVVTLDEGIITTSKREGKDSMAMFGILGAPVLRTAQTQFQSALDELVELVNAGRAVENALIPRGDGKREGSKLA